jgi:hypothetical protein
VIMNISGRDPIGMLRTYGESVQFQVSVPSDSWSVVVGISYAGP